MPRLERPDFKSAKSAESNRRGHPAPRRCPAVETLEPRVLLSFSSPVTYSIGTQPSPFVGNISQDGVATGDFNGDKKPDVAVVHSADNTVNVLLNKGDGTFNPAVAYSTGVTQSDWVTVADVNGDGKPDLLVEGAIGSIGAVGVLLGNGDGTFNPAVVYPTGQGSRGGFAFGDFNGDGKPDLVVAQFASISPTQFAVDILINNGNGTFKPYYTVGVFPAPRAVAVGDFNGDNKADLAVADGFGVNNQLDPTYPAGVTILLGNGDGTFKTVHQYNALPTPDAGNDGKGGGDTVNPEAIKAVDLNGDGKLDLIESLYDHNIDVFLGNGDGSFQPAMGFNTGEYPRTVGVADVNGDGRKDLIVANIGFEDNSSGPETGSVAVLIGNGDGTFQPPFQYTPFNYPGSLAVADFNGDGLPDIAVSRVFDGHSLSIMQDQPTAPVLSSFRVNDGSAQRSMVDSLTVTFSQQVTLAPGALSLNLLSQTGGPPTPMPFNLNSTGGGLAWVLTFTDPAYIGGSLPDGAYTLTVTARGVTDAQALPLAGGDQSFTFTRLYGDFTGQGLVNATDLATFSSLFNKTVNSTDWYVDFNGDGIINATDLSQFGANFGKAISTPSQPAFTPTLTFAAATNLTTPLPVVTHRTGRRWAKPR